MFPSETFVMIGRRFALTSMCFIAFLTLSASNVQAGGGAWGGSLGGGSLGGGAWGGSLGGGSWGSGGGLLNGAPVRNLLSRLGARAANVGANARSMLASRGSLGGNFGSGGGFANGGSRGGYASAGSRSWGSAGSAGSYVSTAPVSVAPVTSMGSIGSMIQPYLAVAQPAISLPVETGFASYNPFPINQSFGCSDYLGESSYPIGDQGFQPGYPIETSMGSSYPMNQTSGIIESQIVDGGSIDSMLDGGMQYSLPGEISGEGGVGGIPIEGGSVVEPVPNGPGYYNTPPAGGFPDVEAPGPVDDGSTMKSSPDEFSPAVDYAVLKVVVPEDTTVLINGKSTKTEGLVRSYVSRGLKSDKDYRYRVTMLRVENGKEIEQTRLVSLRPGFNRTVRFEMDQPVVTKLDLKVPANAKVKLCGKEMPSTDSPERTFETTSLKPGQSWDDYKIEVEFERDGKRVRQEKTINIVAGKSYSIAIGIDSNVGPEQMASR